MPDTRTGSASWFPAARGRVACWWVVAVVMGVPFGGVQIGFRRARNEPPGAQDQKATWPPHEVANGGYRNRSGERIGAKTLDVPSRSEPHAAEPSGNLPEGCLPPTAGTSLSLTASPNPHPPTPPTP